MSLGLGLFLAPATIDAQVISATRVASRVSRPVFVTAPPGDKDRLFIVEQQTGRIEILDLRSGVIAPDAFLQIRNISRSNEQGLLGLAFDPDYSTSGQFYVNFTDSSGDTRIERFQVSDNPNRADVDSRFSILEYSQPQRNHNGGWIGFGPNDGLLYIASGDGGAADDTGFGHTPGTGNAQDITNNLLGKLLRIDPRGDDFPEDAGRNYAIPDSNPFVNETGDDEIWSYGLRNPWRVSFDRETGDLYIGDVGQVAREEIDFQSASSPGGENYGWRLREGTIATPGVGGPAPEGAVEPIHEYRRTGAPDGGFSVTGGYVYRGPIAELQGHYFFADFVSDQIWSFKYDGQEVTDFQNRTSSFSTDAGRISNVSSFGEDDDGNLYIVSLDGNIFRLDGITGPSGDLNDNGILDAGDIDILSEAIRNGDDDRRFDLNIDGVIDADDRTTWVVDLKSTWFGDANLNGEFDEADLILVLQIGQYEDATIGNSGWAEGDWNGDAEFDSGDLVAALQQGGYLQGPRPAIAAVPEPAALGIVQWAILLASLLFRRPPHLSPLPR